MENTSHLERRIDSVEDQIKGVAMDVSAIRDAIMGSKIYPGNGMINKMTFLEAELKRQDSEIKTIKQNYNSDRSYGIGAAAAIAVAVSVGAWLLIFLFK